MIKKRFPKRDGRTWPASVAAAAAFILLAATVPASAQLVGGPKEPFLEDEALSRHSLSGYSRIDHFNGELRDVPICSNTFQKVPEGGAAGASRADEWHEGTSPDLPGNLSFCPWCAPVGLAVGLIMLAIKLYEIYRDLSADPDWTYDQTLACTVTGYSVWTQGSGALLRRVSLVHEGETSASCEYEGVLNGYCEAKFVASGETLTWTKSFRSDIVHSYAEPCFAPDARAHNDPQVAAMGGLKEEWKPVEKTFGDFHPEGLCGGRVLVAKTELPAAEDAVFADPGSLLGSENHSV